MPANGRWDLIRRLKVKKQNVSRQNESAGTKTKITQIISDDLDP